MYSLYGVLHQRIDTVLLNHQWQHLIGLLGTCNGCQIRTDNLLIATAGSKSIMEISVQDDKNHLRYLTCGHSDHLLKSINRLRKERKLCDITLKVGEKEFHAHRVILSACSDYFCAMFTGDMEESNKSVVELHGLDSDTMEFILDFVYTETIQVSVENVQALLPAACLLQLTGL